MYAMKHFVTHRWAGMLLALLLVLTSCQPKTPNPSDYAAQPVLEWNELVMQLAIAQDGLFTLNGVRTEALMHTAMHNALNAIVPRYAFYHYTGSQPLAHPNAALAQAGYEVAIASFPDQKEALEALLNSQLAAVEAGTAKDLGIALGKETAAALLKDRNHDRWNGEADYTWHPMAPGVYAEFNEHSGTPEGFIFGAGWAAAQPFLLTSSDQFRSPPPPDIQSDAYTEAFNEVKTVGSTHSTVRTADQAHLALWWKDFVEHSHNRLARDLIQKEQLNLWEATRALALLNLAVYDAYVCVFDNKFYYNHWRPFTAIRWAAHDENPNTEPDEEWNNLHMHTYAFPSYPSAHGTASSAAMRTLSNTLGKGDAYAFTMTTEEVDKAGPMSGKIKMDPPTRSFQSFTEAGLEAAMSRVYLGIHFRYDSEEGHRLGNAIGDYANANYMKPLGNDDTEQ